MDIRKFIMGVGAVAEMTKVFYDHYLRVGFTPPQALELARSMTIAELQIAAFMPKDATEHYAE